MQAALVAVLAGLAGALVELRARSADHDARDELLTTAVAIARSISAERFSALSFTTDDELLLVSESEELEAAQPHGKQPH